MVDTEENEYDKGFEFFLSDAITLLAKQRATNSQLLAILAICPEEATPHSTDLEVICRIHRAHEVEVSVGRVHGDPGPVVLEAAQLVHPPEVLNPDRSELLANVIVPIFCLQDCHPKVDFHGCRHRY